MKTTSLFVEIIIIGAGLFTWVLLLVFTLFGFTWVNEISTDNSLLLVPTLSFLYVLGILWDRAADIVSDVWDKPIKKKYFDSIADYHLAKDKVYSNSEQLRDLFDYTRSRMRICRSWMFDLFIIAVLIPFFIYYKTDIDCKLFAVSFFTIFFLLLSILAFISWRKLTHTFYQRLKHSKSTIED